MYEMDMSWGRYGIFYVNPDSGDMIMDSCFDNYGNWSSVQVTMDQWYLEYYWEWTENTGYYSEIYEDLFVLYDGMGYEILEYDAFYDSYVICNCDLYCSVVYAEGAIAPEADIDMQDFAGQFGYDGSFEADGYFENFYYYLEIEGDNSVLSVTEMWRGNYLINYAYVTADNLVGNTLIFSGYSESSEVPEKHFLTYIPAAESPLGKDTIYLDGEYEMPFVRE